MSAGWSVRVHPGWLSVERETVEFSGESEAAQGCWSCGVTSWNGTGIPVPTRVGIHRGNAKAEAGHFFGRAVVVAARISGAAAGDEILASQEVQEGFAALLQLELLETSL